MEPSFALPTKAKPDPIMGQAITARRTMSQ
jgi:hypothetical protein